GHRGGLDPRRRVGPALRLDGGPRARRHAAARRVLRRADRAAGLSARAAGEAAAVITLRSLLDEHVTPLQRKVRARALDELAARLAALEPNEAQLPDAPRLATLALPATQIVQQIEEDIAELDRRFHGLPAPDLQRPGA